MSSDYWPVHDPAAAEPKDGFSEFSGPGDPQPGWTTAGLQGPGSIAADPAADQPVPYWPTSAAEMLGPVEMFDPGAPDLLWDPAEIPEAGS